MAYLGEMVETHFTTLVTINPLDPVTHQSVVHYECVIKETFTSRFSVNSEAYASNTLTKSNDNSTKKGSMIQQLVSPPDVCIEALF